MNCVVEPLFYETEYATLHVPFSSHVIEGLVAQGAGASCLPGDQKDVDTVGNGAHANV
jgi:hypothetical protein